MKYVGIDLTSAFSTRPRPIDVAVISQGNDRSKPTAIFHQIRWPAPALVAARDIAFLYAMLAGNIVEGEKAIFAIDGPQGLAATGVGRNCELRLGTPGRTRSVLPATNDTGPFQTYIRSSIDLFNSLLSAPIGLAGLNGTPMVNAMLFEVFPGAEWTVLAGKRLARKATVLGRTQRKALFGSILELPQSPSLPTPDQLDALVGAYLAWCTRNRPAAVELVGIAPTLRNNELCEGFILHATDLAPGAAGLAGEAVEPPAPVEPAVDTTEGNWNEDDLMLFLHDYGVVWGSDRENAWMQPGQNYVCQTLAPHPLQQFQLAYAPAVSGGRGWTCEPKVKPLLSVLGLPTPPHLSRATAVTLRIRLVP